MNFVVHAIENYVKAKSRHWKVSVGIGEWVRRFCCNCLGMPCVSCLVVIVLWYLIFTQKINKKMEVWLSSIHILQSYLWFSYEIFFSMQHKSISTSTVHTQHRHNIEEWSFIIEPCVLHWEGSVVEEAIFDSTMDAWLYRRPKKNSQE